MEQDDVFGLGIALCLGVDSGRSNLHYQLDLVHNFNSLYNQPNLYPTRHQLSHNQTQKGMKERGGL